MQETCPRCQHRKYWTIRRQRRRCSRCRYEWRPALPLRLDKSQWEKLLRTYIRGGNCQMVAQRTGLHLQRVLRALKLVRTYMSALNQQVMGASLKCVLPTGYSKPLNGNATILSVLCPQGTVWAHPIARGEAKSYLSELKRQMNHGAIVCSDLLSMNRKSQKHILDAVTHIAHRSKSNGRPPLDGLTGFWTSLAKSRLMTWGKAHPEQLDLYVAEGVWRYNHRSLSIEQRVHRLMRLIAQPLARISNGER